MKQITHQSWEYSLLILLIFGLGISIGSIAQFAMLQKPTTLKRQNNYQPETLPTLELTKIENGILIGKTNQQVRMISLENNQIISAENDFKIDITPLLPRLQIIPHPDDMQYVASKRGKYYWPLDSIEAHQIKWSNRVFFKNNGEAEASGYSKK